MIETRIYIPLMIIALQSRCTKEHVNNLQDIHKETGFENVEQFNNRLSQVNLFLNRKVVQYVIRRVFSVEYPSVNNDRTK